MTATPAEIVRALRDELATPGRYHLTTPVAHPNPIARAISWVLHQAARGVHWLWQHFGWKHAPGPIVANTVVVIAGLVLGAVILYLATRIEIERAARSGALPLQAPRNAQRFAIDAAAAADAGDYARAARLLFIAAVTLLDLRGVVRDERSATVEELRRELVARDAALEAPFAELSRAYTRAAYAQEPPDAAMWSSMQHAYARLRERSGS